jgi:hypothetical protein
MKLIMERHSLPYTPKNFTTFTTSSTPVEALRRGTRGIPRRENFTTPVEIFCVW